MYNIKLDIILDSIYKFQTTSTGKNLEARHSWANVGPASKTVGQRWANISTALSQRVVFAGCKPLEMNAPRYTNSWASRLKIIIKSQTIAAFFRGQSNDLPSAWDKTLRKNPDYYNQQVVCVSAGSHRLNAIVQPHHCMVVHLSDVQSQKAVTAYFSSKQILPSGFAGQP